VIELDASTGALIWKLSGDGDTASSYYDPPDFDPSDTGFPSVDTDFADQHDVHSVAADTLLMFDNQGDATQSRVLQIMLDPVGTAMSTGSALIEKLWPVVDDAGGPEACSAQGSAEAVGSGSVLALCNFGHFVEELGPDADHGAPLTVPTLFIQLDSPACPPGFGPSNPNSIHGWYRAFPLAKIGDFE
jgi:hypothetical protein